MRRMHETLFNVGLAGVMGAGLGMALDNLPLGAGDGCSPPDHVVVAEVQSRTLD